MGQGAQPAERKSCAQLQVEYAILIRDQMRRQGISVRCLVAEGVIRQSHRNGFFRRVEEGSLSYKEVNQIAARLNIDPVRAALTVVCFNDPESYEDPCCETTAELAASMAVELREEMDACDGNFDGLAKGLCKGLAKRTVNEIAKNHARLEAARDAITHVDESYG